MRVVIQRVKKTTLSVDGQLISSIPHGLAVYFGVKAGDTEAQVDYAVKKIAGMRIFEDEAGKMNRSILDEGGEILAISQFTLAGDARHGRRPSFSHAARPEMAEPLFELLCKKVADKGIHVETGRFRTHMEVSLVNDGPVTILLDSKKGF